MALFSKQKLGEIKENEAAKVSSTTIMIVDDEDANLRVMADVLQPSYQLIRARDGQEALDILASMKDREKIACIVSDQRMPRLTGVEMLEKSRQLVPGAVRIIVTGFVDLDAIIDSINKAEIYKFIVKPFDANDFSLTIKRGVESFQMKQELESYHRELEKKVELRTLELAQKNEELQVAYRNLEEVSLTDPLTGLRNRRFLLQKLEEEVHKTLLIFEQFHAKGLKDKVVGKDLLFFLVDIDHFKSVNDQYGHAAGDAVLSQMRERLMKVFRDDDYLVRWGGEEFLAVGRGANRFEAMIMAERIRAAVADRPFKIADEQALSKTCSVGFACFPFLTSDSRRLSWAQVVEIADQGLYMAKRGGRNAWVGLSGTEKLSSEVSFEYLIENAHEAVEKGILRLTTNLAL